MLQEKLCQIGLTVNEAKVYLEMLRIGPQGASVIAKRSAINRTTTYSVLNELEKKGVVGVVVEGRCRLFQANDPNSLVAYLDRQSKTFDYLKEEILTVIHQIRETTGRYKFKGPVAKYYDGIAGVKYALQDVLTAKSEVLAFVPSCGCFHGDLRVPFRAIVADIPDLRSFFDDNYYDCELINKILYVRLEKGLGYFKNGMIIFDDKVVIVYPEKGAEYALVIESHEMAVTQRTVFEMAWKGFVGR